jgi:prepilin-type N-terminal cleavage/methylation domain-containing protein
MRMEHQLAARRRRSPAPRRAIPSSAARLVRAFTLVEVSVVAAIVGIAAAISIPVVVSTAKKHASESAPQLVAQAISRGRDSARDMLRCVTVLVRGPLIANGPQTIAAYLHDSPSCAPDFVNANNPGVNATTIAEVSIAADAVRSLSVLRPRSGCDGLPPPVSCYEIEPTARFILRADGTTDKPYRIRLTRPDDSTEFFLVFPQTGTIRFER